MTTKEKEKALRVALQAAKLGGQVTLKYFKKLKHVSIKDGAGLVSEADRESESVIKKTVHKTYPSHKFLGEEGGMTEGSGSNALWVVDPLDGTTNYVHGFPFYCVSIALEVDGVTEVGIIHVPVLKQTYTAMRGKGAYLNDKRMKVSKTSRIEDSLLATGFSYKKSSILVDELKDFKILAERSQGVRRAGSAALDLCMVASGVFDGFWERELAPWDTAAGVLLVTEAGGVVTTFQNKPFHFSMKTVLAGNPKIHPLLHKTLSGSPT